MITKYKASAEFSMNIERIECLRETATMIYTTTGSGRKKLTQYESYFDTFEEAKAHLIAIGEREVTQARLRLNTANGRLGNAKGLRQGLIKS